MSKDGMTLDEWAGKQAGIRFEQTWKGRVWYLNDKLYEYEWTLKDARCREIVLEWIAEHPEYYRFLHGYMNNWMAGKMKKAEAEIACIKWRQKNED